MAASKQHLWWYGFSALYSAVILGASLLWPGPGDLPPMPSYYRHVAPATPPVEQSSAPSYFSRTSAEGSARVFWSMPENGEVKMTITIPPETNGRTEKHQQ